MSTVNINADLVSSNFANEEEPTVECIMVAPVNDEESLISVSSATELNDCDETVVYDVDRPTVSLSFGINNCNQIDISTNKTSFKRVLVCTQNNDTTVDCEIIEDSQLSVESTLDENMNESNVPKTNPLKKSAVSVNLQIKRKKLSDDATENSKVLILNTDAIEKLSHVIIQPPNYKLVKRQTLQRNKINSSVRRKCVASPRKNGKVGDNLKQRTIADYLSCKANVLNLLKVSDVRTDDDQHGDATVVRDVGQDMSKNLGVTDAIKCERVRRGSCKSRNNDSPKSAKPSSRRGSESSPRHQDIKISCSDAPRVPSPRSKNDSISSHSPRKNVESIQFSLPPKSKSTKTSSVCTRNIPHHKIVAGM